MKPTATTEHRALAPAPALPADLLARGRAQDVRTLLLTVGVFGLVMGVATSIQSVLILGARSQSMRGMESAPLQEVLLYVSINILTVIAVVLAAIALVAGPKIQDRRLGTQVLLVLLASITVAGLRVILRLTTGIYSLEDMTSYLTDAGAATGIVVAIFVVALLLTNAQRRARTADWQRIMHATRAANALTSLQQEELRVRRAVADSLHGTVQNRFVLLAAELSSIASNVSAPERDRVEAVRSELDNIREHELRSLSSALYPEEIDRGLVPALRALTARVPASIRMDIDIDEAVTGASDELLDTEGRLTLLRVAEEGITNALRHGDATRVGLRLSLAANRLALEITDDGSGVLPSAELHGIARLRERLERIGGGLELVPLTGGGAGLRSFMHTGYPTAETGATQ